METISKKKISGLFKIESVRIHESLVSYYTKNLCEALEIDSSKVAMAALFHDVGKFIWDERLFYRQRCKLTQNDFSFIKYHPKKGVEYIINEYPEKKEEFIRGNISVFDMILYHHEKPDGSGYYGIKDIPIEVAILSISDIFDACLSDRLYRRGLGLRESLEQAIEPFRGYLKHKGIDERLIRKVLAQKAIKVTFCSIT